jgi:hypothetical protein
MTSYANTNHMARAAYDALNTAQDALSGLEIALDLHKELPGISRDDLFEFGFDLPVYRAIIGRMKAHTTKIVRATNQ